MSATSEQLNSKLSAEDKEFYNALYQGNLTAVKKLLGNPVDAKKVSNRLGRNFSDPFPLRVVIQGLSHILFNDIRIKFEDRKLESEALFVRLRQILQNYLEVFEYLFANGAKPNDILLVPKSDDEAESGESLSFAQDTESNDNDSFVLCNSFPSEKTNNLYDEFVKANGVVFKSNDATSIDLINKIFESFVKNGADFENGSRKKYGLHFLSRAEMEKKQLEEQREQNKKKAAALKKEADELIRRGLAIQESAKECEKQAHLIQNEVDALQSLLKVITPARDNMAVLIAAAKDLSISADTNRAALK